MRDHWKDEGRDRDRARMGLVVVIAVAVGGAFWVGLIAGVVIGRLL